MDKIRNRSRSTSTSANSATTKVSKVLKRVGDKVRVGVALFDDVAKSLAKATNHDKVPPKEKHVRSMFLYVQFHFFSLFIAKIMHKSTIVYHHLSSLMNEYSHTSHTHTLT